MRNFFRLESASGFVLLIAVALAITLANSPLGPTYFAFFEPLHAVINDGLMSIFFFMVGLEIKREFASKTEKSFQAVSLPIFAALGGMLFPAIIFSATNPDSHAWAVAMPTDIALALGVLALLGSRIEPSVKIFLLTLAIADDLFSIVILGVFYSSGVSPLKIATSLGAVALALALPYKDNRLIDRIHPWSAFFIIPIFAIANIGLVIDIEDFGSSITSGLIVARVIGKILGITLFSYLAVKLSLSYKPATLSYFEICGAGALAAMGLTVSLFIADIAGLKGQEIAQVKLGLLFAALIGGTIGLVLLRFLAKNPSSSKN